MEDLEAGKSRADDRSLAVSLSLVTLSLFVLGSTILCEYSGNPRATEPYIIVLILMFCALFSDESLYSRPEYAWFVVIGLVELGMYVYDHARARGCEFLEATDVAFFFLACVIVPMSFLRANRHPHLAESIGENALCFLFPSAVWYSLVFFFG
jgi:hypothetical protein